MILPWIALILAGSVVRVLTSGLVDFTKLSRLWYCIPASVAHLQSELVTCNMLVLIGLVHRGWVLESVFCQNRKGEAQCRIKVPKRK